VCFIDMGLSCASIFLVNYKKEGDKIISHIHYIQSENNLGSRDFDNVIMKHFANQFKE